LWSPSTVHAARRSNFQRLTATDAVEGIEAKIVAETGDIMGGRGPVRFEKRLLVVL
jgi:hypothetical protein